MHSRLVGQVPLQLGPVSQLSDEDHSEARTTAVPSGTFSDGFREREAGRFVDHWGRPGMPNADPTTTDIRWTTAVAALIAHSTVQNRYRAANVISGRARPSAAPSPMARASAATSPRKVVRTGAAVLFVLFGALLIAQGLSDL